MPREKFFEPFSSLGSALKIGESSIHRPREPCDTAIFHQIPDLFSYLPFSIFEIMLNGNM
jgi:hypothetical protein